MEKIFYCDSCHSQSKTIFIDDVLHCEKCKKEAYKCPACSKKKLAERCYEPEKYPANMFLYCSKECYERTK